MGRPGSYHPRHHLIRRLAHSYHGFAHSSAVVPPSHSYVPHHQHHDASATDPHAELGSGGQHWSSERNPLFYPSAAVYHQQQQHEFSAAPPDSHSNVTSAAYVLGAVPANDVHFYRDDAAPIIDHSTGNPHQYDRAVTPEQYESVVTPQQYESVVTSQRYDSRLNSQQYDNTVDSHEYDSTADSQPYDSAVTSPQYDNSSSWHAYPQPFDSYAQRPAIDAKPSSPQPPPIVGDLDHSLLHLEDRAVELIHVTARATDAQIDAILGGADTEDSQVYYTLKNVFEQTRKVYARDDSPFIDPAAIHLDQPGQRETFRKANVATFITIILGEHDGSFVHLNDHFITSFVPLGHRLLKWQGTLLLELKTQVAISALASAADATADPAAILAPLFPPDQHHQIISRHPDAPNLSPDEQEFVDRCAAHKHLLLSQLSTADSHHLLLRQYPWDDFVREFAASIRRNVDSILNDRVMPLAPFSRSTSGLRESPLLQPQPPPPPPLPPSAASSDAATTTATTALMPPPVPLVPSQTDGAVLDGGQEGSETARRSVQRKTWTEPEVVRPSIPWKPLMSRFLPISTFKTIPRQPPHPNKTHPESPPGRPHPRTRPALVADPHALRPRRLHRHHPAQPHPGRSQRQGSQSQARVPKIGPQAACSAAGGDGGREKAGRRPCQGSNGDFG